MSIRGTVYKVLIRAGLSQGRATQKLADAMTALSRSDAMLTKLFTGTLLESQRKESSWINPVFASSIFWLLKVSGCVGSSAADSQQNPPEALTIKLATNNSSSDFYILNTLLNKHITPSDNTHETHLKKKSVIHRHSNKTGSSEQRQPLDLYTGKVNTDRRMGTEIQSYS
jgi:hypothetical protein